MAASPNPCGPALAGWCGRHLQNPQQVAVAYSAGADSTALLLAAHERWPGRVMAIHIHHGLHAAADAFENLALDLCARLGVPIRVCRVDARHAPGQSPEDAARRARYHALAATAREQGADAVLLGQHADDQAETVLLALSRGAGLPGLAGMAERFERDGVLFGRPLREMASQTLRDWLLHDGHPFVDDPTNADARYTRNRIRAVLTPAWQACFPGYREALARSARHAAQAQSLLDELAESDLALTGNPPVIAAVQALSRARQANVLRLWLRRCAGTAPSEVQLDELLDQIDACRTRGHGLRIRVAAGLVVRDADRLRYDRPI
ncbi:tRNA lysidine(34) synthetase TilS [Hydrogenophaga sp. RWCD_12]|uniref:tRNA lysidine(34) synthetase TilS n=1 Tax=Hydrogenophaga sp. RWCD_12 TaxID=3391190 RepID=UPI0039856156